MVDVAGSIGGVVSPLLQVGEWLAAPIWRQFKYVFNYRSNFNSLQEQVDKLKNTRDEAQRKVTAAERNVQEIKQNVKNWQKDVEKTIIEAEQLIQEKANNPRCFKGLCPNFIIHYKQSNKAFKLKRDDIAPLHQQEKDLDPVSYPTNPPKIWLRSSEDYLAFESRNSTMKNVWDALNDNNVFMIGVYGMGGLGKTTLVQEAGRKAKEKKLFEDIVFVEISESLNIEKIQTTIADNLGLEFKNKSDRADELYARMNGKNILLILDNIWEPLEFEKMIGIPCGAGRGRNKLLFTTRNKNVLERMDSTNNFGMHFLKDDEAWTLFTKMAGDVSQTRELNSLPNDVCKECGGLPIVICTIAKALRNKSERSWWENALGLLQPPPPTNFTRPLEESYKKIKLSYDYLEDDKLKKTFIICSLMENDASILDLLKNIKSMGILEGSKLTIKEAMSRLEVWVDELKDRCLLLDGGSKRRFSMHDVIRVVAVTCAYIDYHVDTEKNDVEKEWKDKDKLGLCTTISLVGNDIITQLWPEGLNCLKLEFFQASQMGSSFQIPEGFLIMMPKLKVLNLFEMQQSLLSLSIDCLTNLQTLCLDGSKIEDVTVIEKLKKLKVLSLRNTLIEEFHTNMGQLTQLELLDLSYCRKLKVIAPNVISQLSKLEAFYIKSCSIEWNHGLLEEVKRLSKLTILELDVEDINVLPKRFFSKELKRYNISIGRWQWFLFGNDQLECWRTLQFKFNSTTCLEKLHEIKNVEALLLDESSNEENDIEASKVILQSNETKPLFNKKVTLTDLMSLKLINITFGKIWESQLSTSSYENLTWFSLERCDKIKYVFPFYITKSLQQLRCLKIHYCKVLEKIVEEEEEEEQGIEIVNSIFPHITQLMLRDLPKLTVFYQRAHVLELPLLKELEIEKCPNFTSRYEGFQDNNEKDEVQVSESKSICLKHKINSDLEAIRLGDYWEGDVREINWLSESKTLEISHTNISVGLLQRFYNLEVLFVASNDRLMSPLSFLTYFQNLTILKISYCHGLIKRLITPSMTESLVQLREMRIRGCGLLTEIVENEGDETTIEIVFNNLNKLSLENLNCLTCFCSGNCSFNFPSLEELIIKDCPTMKTFSSGSLSTPKLHNVHYRKSWRDEKKLVKIGENDLNTITQQANKKKVNSALEKLTLSGKYIISIWQGDFEENFGKVKSLKLINDEHAYIPIHILMKFITLERLKLKVSSYEEIFSYEEGEEHVGALAQLKFLKLWGLFNLKCIWKQDFQFKSILQNLCDLTVAYCHNLMTLLPCSSSFKNLTTLEVIYCNGLQNLIASSIAKSLVCLEELKIRECEMMIEVLANEGDKEEDEIVFEKLKELTLVKLKSLTCFYSGNCALNFPFLESLNVSKCFKMKTFSGEGLDMPRLQKVNKKVCTNDLDSIIQQLQNDCSEFCDRMRNKRIKELIWSPLLRSLPSSNSQI
ncbi:disease resistance protein At4g27190-like [Mangifera indica]|uniref:disease resistance protein At4g27190-like n=1 Tax=Mangifera indica TaxID=29780 RepID=UPI001CF974EF|nr:disease resistance protein At4g27190-like [Mangifera indica]